MDTIRVRLFNVYAIFYYRRYSIMVKHIRFDYRLDEFGGHCLCVRNCMRACFGRTASILLDACSFHLTLHLWSIVKRVHFQCQFHFSNAICFSCAHTLSLCLLSRCGFRMLFMHSAFGLVDTNYYGAVLGARCG